MNVFIDYKLLMHKENLPKEEVFLGWPAFLECLGIREEIVKLLPKWDAHSSIHEQIQAILCKSANKDLLICLYDELFARCLTEVKNLPQLQVDFLIKKIEEKKKEGFFEKPLRRYEKLLMDDPYPILHDLTLYLAWDRMCVYLALLFDLPAPFEGLPVFKDCLIESFVHILKQKKCSPSFFRLVEALYAYFLREENIGGHLQEEWDLLSQGSIALRSREELLDVPYIDECISSDSFKTVWTLDRPDQVKSSMGLAKVMIEKIKKESPDISLCLGNVEVICFKPIEKGLSMESKVF